ncbi:hypothetical protein GGX14DRAFT_395590 [Mycena pura]|uniref:Uncharacterized protein n=1 Tax=Mycena pura TaxID=153505 RepID=A0AAD6VG93_9AGAR|nr:hypothetical protein GGX14DRAFT_395590 [Mycena pura]
MRLQPPVLTLSIPVSYNLLPPLAPNVRNKAGMAEGAWRRFRQSNAKRWVLIILLLAADTTSKLPPSARSTSPRTSALSLFALIRDSEHRCGRERVSTRTAHVPPRMALTIGHAASISSDSSACACQSPTPISAEPHASARSTLMVRSKANAANHFYDLARTHATTAGVVPHAASARAVGAGTHLRCGLARAVPAPVLARVGHACTSHEPEPPPFTPAASLPAVTLRVAVVIPVATVAALLAVNALALALAEAPRAI